MRLKQLIKLNRKPRHCVALDFDRSRLRIVAFVLTVALVPLALPLRWGVLGPLSRLIPPLRRIVVGRLSTLVINSDYVRPMPTGEHVRRLVSTHASQPRW